MSQVYKKLSASGQLDPTNLAQTDYDLLMEYLKASFPKATKMQRNLEETLKRTFVLRSDSSGKRDRSFTFSKKVKDRKSKSKRAQVKPVPRKLSYTTFVNVNNLWKQYIAELLRDIESSRTEETQQRLNRVDLHGAEILVAHSNCSDLVGKKGIVIKETRNTFVIVTSENRTKTIPKAEAEFHIETGQPEGRMVIAGNSFLTRPAERASKKVKSFMEFTGVRVYRQTLRYTR